MGNGEWNSTSDTLSMPGGYGNMRIAFLVHWRGGRRTGPFHKIASQVTAWSAQGCDVQIFVATSPDAVADWDSLPVPVHALTAVGTARKALERQRLARMVRDWSPDLVYERHGLYYPGQTALGRRFPLVLEINGDDRNEWRLLSWPKWLYNAATRGRCLAAASGFVFVTHELQASPSFARTSRARPTIVLGNGVSFTGSAPVAEVSKDGPPHLLFVGHPRTPWHGVDHLVEAAHAQPTWTFDVVGLDSAEVGPTPPNVRCHGELAPAEYAQLLAHADVGVGTLALYRKGMEEASALKVREYLAAGLPVVLGCTDTDFPNGAEFLLQVPNRPGGLRDALPSLDSFIGRWRGRRVHRDSIANLEVAVKEKQRLAFLQQVLSQSSR